MLESIPKEHLQQWLGDPITKKVFEKLAEVRKSHQDLLCVGGTVNMESTESTAMRTVRVLGIISGMNLLLEMTAEEE
jgi:heptaprenylglyceryl phosphate synthase